MKFFRDTFQELKIYKDIEKSISKKLTPILVSGLSQVHFAQLMVSMSDNSQNIIVTGNDSVASKIASDINAMDSSMNAVVYPSKELVITLVESASLEYSYQRIAALESLISGKSKAVVCSVESLMQPTIPKEILCSRTFTIENGKSYNLTEIKNKLIESGYVSSYQIEGISQFSSRGDILDIFPVGESEPVRIEFWDDEVDNISYFNIETQRRTTAIESVKILPSTEALFDKNELIDKIKKLQSTVKGKKSSAIKENIARDIERIENGIFFNTDKYYNQIYDKKCSLYDYVSGNVFYYDYNAVAKSAQGVEMQYVEDTSELLERGEIFKGTDEFFIPFQTVKANLSKRCEIYCSNFVQGSEKIPYKQMFSMECFQNSPWGGEMRQLVEDLENYIHSGYRVFLAAGSEKTLSIIQQDLGDSNIKCTIANEDSVCREGEVLLTDGSFSSGFEYPENKTALITQSKSLNSKRKKRKYKAGKEIHSLLDVQSGDLVVHSMYGIGKFAGIRKLELDGVTKDYITIEYQGKENLYVPVTQMDLVSRYIGNSDETKVKLNKLSSPEWQKARNNTKKAVKDLAQELTKLYAEREKAQGFAFYPDDEVQREFEERFPYVETDDQLTSIEEIKEDMESKRPMDRLLCGDVGFGKTEVALRAAMKCILSGKQCAILAPTTVLAWQHYQTSLRRFEPFAVKVELLSRYRTEKQQREILKELEKGTIDLIIGTHRLVQKDVKFKDLGLAIIDEEQRFGVSHKEKFKKAFKGVDVLTLSATPIPRTLNMAMSGLRDMSVLSEAPQDRHPVQTYIMEYSEPVIMQAIQRELKRGGQVYYIHNRVETIELTAGRIQKLFPDAVVEVAHGKLEEQEMSQVWQRVVEHEVDILVCTTIIETGIDVANVNTLIIEDSDKFGLSQLYQLRGRVGRSSRRAYAYFTYKRDKVVSDVAEKRLKAMREFTQFGSGFRIAMRDLEIRGAGSILGGQQHGHMQQVGYEMYMKMLEEAIADAKGETNIKASECVIDLQVDAHIPEWYIESLPQRLDVYRKIAAVENETDSMELTDELIDRYGEPPKSVVGLITVSQMRNRAALVGIEEISQKENKVIVYMNKISPSQLSTLSVVYHGRIVFNSKGRHFISIEQKKKQNVTSLLKEIVETLEKS
jgi:transcription-repair coupling factor (superfamily II helicase)